MLTFTGRMSFKSRHPWIVTPVKLSQRSSSTEGKPKPIHHIINIYFSFCKQNSLSLMKLNFAIPQPPHKVSAQVFAPPSTGPTLGEEIAQSLGKLCVVL